MIYLLFRLSSRLLPVEAVLPTAGEFSGSGTIGFIVLAVIVGPVILLTLASMFGAPRKFTLPGLFLGFVILSVGAIVASFAVVGVLLKFIVPQ